MFLHFLKVCAAFPVCSVESNCLRAGTQVLQGLALVFVSSLSTDGATLRPVVCHLMLLLVKMTLQRLFLYLECLLPTLPVSGKSVLLDPTQGLGLLLVSCFPLQRGFACSLVCAHTAHCACLHSGALYL